VLRWRLLTAMLIIAPLLGLMVADYRYHFGAPGVWLAPLAVLFSIAAVAEVLDLFRSKNLRPSPWSVHAGALMVVLTGMVPLVWGLSGASYSGDLEIGRFGWSLLALPMASALIFVVEMIRFRQPGESVVNVALGILTVVYIAVPVSFLVGLRLYKDNAWGMTALVSLVLIVKMSDTGAYFSGRWLGRRKMAPLLSPKKTIAGFVGGLLTAAAVSWIFFDFVAPSIVGSAHAGTSPAGALVYGLLIGVAGVIGDLSESLLKRDMERKDSSCWMPGLGGVLDVLDSLLFAAPIAYLCWFLRLVGP
jgi:phosphatidate cytidylyltransferase